MPRGPAPVKAKFLSSYGMAGTPDTKMLSRAELKIKLENKRKIRLLTFAAVHRLRLYDFENYYRKDRHLHTKQS